MFEDARGRTFELKGPQTEPPSNGRAVKHNSCNLPGKENVLVCLTASGGIIFEPFSSGGRGEAAQPRGTTPRHRPRLHGDGALLMSPSARPPFLGGVMAFARSSIDSVAVRFSLGDRMRCVRGVMMSTRRVPGGGGAGLLGDCGSRGRRGDAPGREGEGVRGLPPPQATPAAATLWFRVRCRGPSVSPSVPRTAEGKGQGKSNAS